MANVTRPSAAVLLLVLVGCSTSPHTPGPVENAGRGAVMAVEACAGPALRSSVGPHDWLIGILCTAVMVPVGVVVGAATGDWSSASGDPKPAYELRRLGRIEAVEPWPSGTLFMRRKVVKLPEGDKVAYLVITPDIPKEEGIRSHEIRTVANCKDATLTARSVADYAGENATEYRISSGLLVPPVILPTGTGTALASVLGSICSEKPFPPESSPDSAQRNSAGPTSLPAVVDQDPKLNGHGCAPSNATEGSSYRLEDKRRVTVNRVLGESPSCAGARPLAVEVTFTFD
jgi:hypothetical protein